MQKRKKSESQQALEAAYRKERKRVLQLIRRNEKVGIFLDNPPPSIPKRITQGSINRLKKINAEYIRQKGYAVDIETGEVISVQKAKNIFKKKATAKAKKTKQKNLVTKLTDDEMMFLIKEKQELEKKYGKEKVDIAGIKKKDGKYKVDAKIWTEEELALKSFYEFLNTINENAANILKKWIDDLVKELGQGVVGKMIIDAYAHGLDFNNKVRYDNLSLTEMIGQFMTYLDADQKLIDRVMEELGVDNSGVDPELW